MIMTKAYDEKQKALNNGKQQPYDELKGIVELLAENCLEKIVHNAHHSVNYCFMIRP